MSHCPECGGKVRLLAVAGRRTHYKSLPNLDVPATLQIPTCEQCGEEWMNGATARAIDTAMEPVYRARLRQMVQSAIAILSEQVSQSELERKLGMAQGYLTKAQERQPRSQHRRDRDDRADLVLRGNRVGVQHAHVAEAVSPTLRTIGRLAKALEIAVDRFIVTTDVTTSPPRAATKPARAARRR